MEPAAPEQHGKLYWFVHHSLTGIRNFLRAHKRILVLLSVLLLLLCFLFRSLLHPAVLEARKHLFLIVLHLLVVLWMARQFYRRGWLGRIVSGTAGCVVLVTVFYVGGFLFHYFSLYFCYTSLNIVELVDLPVSDHERIQPLNSVFSLAYEAMSETESPMTPDFVRVGDAYNWTIAIEPSYPVSRIFSGVKEIYSISGTAPSPNFAKQNRVPVNFQVGEHLLLSRNSHTSTVRAFSPWRYLNYEPVDVSYFPDEKGEWVEVVMLIRWRGLFFPAPEFGGVQLIRQEESTYANALKRFIFGSGEWIEPENISRYPFLVGQNIVSNTISRYMANSFRFQGGLMAPMPGYHRGDIRIPDLRNDENNQPFTGFFKRNEEQQGMLYQYFALEPFDPDKHGLSTSLFVPADGTPVVYVYRHYQHSGSLIGVSAIAAKVEESRKNYDWSRNHPVEHRPFIRDFHGERRFFWLTTVVTMKDREKDKEKDEEGQRFIAGSIPDLILTDARYNTPIWVNPRAPETWVPQIESEMAKVWDSK